ncbi:MAG: T9SS type A sorting domain-containing protein [candidate division Zixibacteria bacterium]|nr:T9SS type A sorting domain-containing protein [candidate division Zixibacteria bacterium]
MKLKELALVTLIVSMLLSGAFAAEIKIPADYSNIQGGIDAATVGDTVLVAAGTYAENISFSGKSITVLSEDGAELTIVAAASSSTPVVDFPTGSNSSTLLSGFTIDGDNSTRGIVCIGSDPTIDNCIIENGYSNGDGGGLFIEHCGPIVQNCTVKSNYGRVTGAGLFARLGFGYGQVQVLDNVFYGNLGSNGPAVSFIGGEGGVVSGNLVYGNNVSDVGSYIRGVVYMRADSVDVTNNTIVNNEGSLTHGVLLLTVDDLYLTHNIVANNDAAGIELRDDDGANGLVVIDYNDVWNNNGNDYIGLASAGTHDISADPLFCLTTGGIYELTSPSPCLPTNNPHGVLVGAFGEGCSGNPISDYYYVPSVYSTIQAAIDATMEDNDTVLVAAGTYIENISFTGKSITVLSEDGAELTTIKAASSFLPVVELLAGSSSSTCLSGFTIDGENTTRGIVCIGSDPIIDNCIIENGYSDGDGGGLFIQHCGPIVQNCTVRSNYCGVTGAGLFARLGFGYGQVQVLDNVFYGNYGSNGPAIGLIQGEGAVVTGNLVYGNFVDNGGSYIRGVVYLNGDSMSVTNNTIVNNIGDLTHGALLISVDDVYFTHNIVAGNGAAGIELRDNDGANGLVVIDYNDVWDNGGNDYIGFATAGTHDISADPQFCDAEALNFTLHEYSPCLPDYNVWGVSIGAFGQGCAGGELQLLSISNTRPCIMTDGTVRIPVYAKLTNNVCGLQIPLTWDADVDLADVDFTGSAIDEWEYPATSIDNENNTVVFGGASGLSDPITSGENVLIATLVFDYAGMCSSGEEVITIETTTVSSTSLLFVGCEEPTAIEFVPPVSMSPVTIETYMAGDANGNCSVNIGDAVYIINYVFKGGVAPSPLDAGDANGDGEINVGDVVFIINYIFRGGDAPQCGCLVETSLNGNNYSPDRSNPILTIFRENDKTVIAISSNYDIYGLQLEIKNSSSLDFTNLIPNTEMFAGTKNSITRLGLLDLNGRGYIPADNNVYLITTSEEIEIISGMASDIYGQTVQLKFSGSGSLPQKYELMQNRPNPFNPSTSISFSLIEGGDVLLEVFNIVGQRISTLVDKYYEPGTHTVVWYGQDDNGHRVSSGIYLYTIKTLNMTETKKMMLLK